MTDLEAAILLLKAYHKSLSWLVTDAKAKEDILRNNMGEMAGEYSKELTEAIDLIELGQEKQTNNGRR